METTIIITVLITLGSVILIGAFSALGIFVHKLGKNKLSCDDAANIEKSICDTIDELRDELYKNVEDINEKQRTQDTDFNRRIEEEVSSLDGKINSRCDKLYLQIQEQKNN